MKLSGYIRANRKASREVELFYENGWKSIRKVHSSKKVYNRKDKNNIIIYDE